MSVARFVISQKAVDLIGIVKSATDVIEQGKFQENNYRDNFLTDGELNIENSQLATVVMEENEMGRGGFEPPTHGFSVRCSKNVTPEKTKTCETTKEQLTPQLTPKSQKQGKIDTSELPSDLAEIVAVWPELPEYLRTAIKALIETHKAEKK